LLQAAVAAAALAGCAGHDPPQTSSIVHGLCEGRNGGPLDGFSFRASDGARLVGVMLGDGDVGVVVAHGYGGSLCDELPLVDDLVDRGYTVLAYDARGFGSSPVPIRDGHESSFSADVEGAVASLRERGIRTIALVGDSFGGTTVVAAAPLLDPRPAAVVSISGPPSLAGYFGD
jgi:alpha-beta hydrolase superfamily lysophospholipase